MRREMVFVLLRKIDKVKGEMPCGGWGEATRRLGDDPSRGARALLFGRLWVRVGPPPTRANVPSVHVAEGREDDKANILLGYR